jgi:hypothetical protein
MTWRSSPKWRKLGAIILAMTRRVKREEWLQDIEARQRNVVFPDTVNNEARFWRNIIEGKQKLSTVQRVGIGLMVLVVGVIAFVITFDWGNPFYPGFSRWNLLSGVIRWVFGFGILALFLVAFRLSQRRKP